MNINMITNRIQTHIGNKNMVINTKPKISYEYGTCLWGKTVGKPPLIVHVTIISGRECMRASAELSYKPLPGKVGQSVLSSPRACGSRVSGRRACLPGGCTSVPLPPPPAPTRGGEHPARRPYQAREIMWPGIRGELIKHLAK